MIQNALAVPYWQTTNQNRVVVCILHPVELWLWWLDIKKTKKKTCRQSVSAPRRIEDSRCFIAPSFIMKQNTTRWWIIDQWVDSRSPNFPLRLVSSKKRYDYCFSRSKANKYNKCLSFIQSSVECLRVFTPRVTRNATKTPFKI